MLGSDKSTSGTVEKELFCMLMEFSLDEIFSEKGSVEIRLCERFIDVSVGISKSSMGSSVRRL